MKMELRISLLGFLLFCACLATGQKHEVEEIIQAVPFEKPDTFKLDGFLLRESAPLIQVRSTSARIESAKFNMGNISDPLLLLQGKIAGAQIYNRGGDPNTQALIRIRGLNGYSNSEPLVVIDGIPGGSLFSIDPYNIKEITIIKDAATQAQYGIRSSNGVVNITTKNNENNSDTLLIKYHNQFSVALNHPNIAVTSAEEFLQAGGNDFGSITDWNKELTQAGISHNHNLVAEGNILKTNYRISGTYRKQNGILKRSDLEQYNLHLNISKQFLQDKIELNLSGTLSQRKSQLGFKEAFRYASNINPTNPILAVGAPFAYDGDRFGGYFESIGLFDDYNPIALINLNNNNALLENQFVSTRLNYKVTDDLSIKLNLGFNHAFSNLREYNSAKSKFRGNASSPIETKKGSAYLKDQNETFTYGKLVGIYNINFSKSYLSFVLGTDFQRGSEERQTLDLTSISDEDLIRVKKINDNSTWGPFAKTRNTLLRSWNDNYLAYFGNALFQLDNKLVLAASLRQEASSKLGIENQSGLFPSARLELNVKDLVKINALDWFTFKTSYGKTGNVPDQGGLSKQQSKVFISDGMESTTIIHETNSSLTFESKSELNFGIDIGWKKMKVQADWFKKQFGDFIIKDFFETNTYVNKNEFSASGFELSLDLELIDKQDLSYEIGAVFSSYRSKIEKLDRGAELIGFPGGPGQGSVKLLALQEGLPLGTIWGTVFNNVDQDGIVELADINNDGQLNTGYDSALDPEGDFQKLGSGFPTFELGMSHYLNWKTWRFSAMLRGAFGHSLVNLPRLFNEPRNNPNYNYVNTDLADPRIRSNQYSSLYVEKADFLKLDNIAISKTIGLNHTKFVELVNLTLAAQNLLVFSQYTGSDPEPVLFDQGVTSNGERLNVEFLNPLVSGVDSRNFYLPSRLISFSLQVVF